MRKLVLRHERLVELGTDELTVVVGGTHGCTTLTTAMHTPTHTEHWCLTREGCEDLPGIIRTVN